MQGVLPPLLRSGLLPELFALLSVRLLDKGSCHFEDSFPFQKGLVYAELGLTLPQAGSDYTYVRETFGDLGGFLVIWVMFWNTGNSIS